MSMVGTGYPDSTWRVKEALLNSMHGCRPPYPEKGVTDVAPPDTCYVQKIVRPKRGVPYYLCGSTRDHGCGTGGYPPFCYYCV